MFGAIAPKGIQQESRKGINSTQAEELARYDRSIRRLANPLNYSSCLAVISSVLYACLLGGIGAAETSSGSKESLIVLRRRGVGEQCGCRR